MITVTPQAGVVAIIISWIAVLTLAAVRAGEGGKRRRWWHGDVILRCTFAGGVFGVVLEVVLAVSTTIALVHRANPPPVGERRLFIGSSPFSVGVGVVRFAIAPLPFLLSPFPQLSQSLPLFLSLLLSRCLAASVCLGFATAEERSTPSPALGFGSFSRQICSRRPI